LCFISAIKQPNVVSMISQAVDIANDGDDVFNRADG
jgi:hypothetical protein